MTIQEFDATLDRIAERCLEEYLEKDAAKLPGLRDSPDARRVLHAHLRAYAKAAWLKRRAGSGSLFQRAKTLAKLECAVDDLERTVEPLKQLWSRAEMARAK